ncbi:MAG: phosphoribosylamine--glycine ligase [Pseudomonadota bacterium]|nr:phosphoribosylamine--glycine ligase [Pseudomonadota bacterium]MEE3093117.1 phosphoribosylamine--glycine ligase [Pseudomonadota bacterium]
MKVLVVGSGGREHALCWSIAASPLCDKLYCAPGNAGIAAEAECVPIGAEDVPALVDFAKSEAIDFVVVGPEAPLCAGLVDRLTEAGIKAFGPSAAAAQLEGSKGFMKDLCAKYDIPTAAYGRFSDAEAAKAYIREQGAPIVVKADGLAAGKGVTVAQTLDEALAAVDDALLDGRFGAAGAEVVVEAFLAGEEVSVFAICDGNTALVLASAQDHKAVYDGDKGPNTGGMGAYSPAPVMDDDLAARVEAEFIKPTMAAMAAEGCPYQGVLFAGLMVDEKGPKLLEYNVRFGDPECQVLMTRLMSDVLPALIAAADGVLDTFDLRWYDDEVALTVVMASEGYPGDYEKGTEIKGIDTAMAADENVMVFHAGTGRDETGKLLATGGRVLNVTARGATVKDAQTRAYAAIDRIDWPKGFCRRDIGWRAVAREEG